jgi:hypothetical protein
MGKITAIFIASLFLFGPALAASAGPSDAGAVFGRRIPPSYVKAAHVVRLAKNGDIRAQAYLGFMYQTGKGVPQHYEKAAYWFGRAAENGHGDAQFALGLLYNKGQGVPMDVVQAYKWLNLSASQAEREDREFKVRIRDSIAVKMSVAQLETAQQLSRDWYRGVHLHR